MSIRHRFPIPDSGFEIICQVILGFAYVIMKGNGGLA